MNSAGETVCEVCNAGHYAENGAATACDECEPGSAAAGTGFTACVPCAPGRHISIYSATRCEDCGMRTFSDSTGMSECLSCAQGRYALVTGLTACFNCEPGRYAQSNGSSECTQCEYGQYTGQSQSTGCRRCSADLPGPAQHWTTMSPINDTHGEAQWKELLAATSVSSCGCRPGTQPDGAANINFVDGGSPDDPIGGRGNGCKVCGEGLNCLGMGQLRILEGYAWDGELSVYDCAQAVLDACSGGLPGTCAPGRDETKVACAECTDGWVANSDGSCSACNGFDYTVPVISVLGLVAVGIFGYFVYDRPGVRKRPSLTKLLVLISMGQMLTIIQQLGIVSSIRVEWDKPMSDVLDMIAVIGFFDVDILRPACMVSMSPVRSYILRVVAMYAALLLVVAAHKLSTILQHRGQRPRSHWFVLLCALGTIVMAFFVSIISTMLGPLQCKKHPNDTRTISWFPSVVCWEDDRHTTMLVIGVTACILPTVFLAASSWAAYVFPAQLKKGSPLFLTGWAFLFFRYQAEAYWYGPVQLMRNALISTAPVLHTALLQTLFLQLVMLLSLVIVARVMPWRATFANHLEIIIHVCFLSLVLCACFFVKEEPASQLAVFGTIVIFMMPLGILVLVGLGVYKMYQSRGKPYQFFLCHHKVGAGAFCRLLKMRLLKTRGVTRKVFVDTDDLQNLGTLFDMVDQDTECLVAIHSAHLLTRPWCIGEITTAHRAKILIQVVRLPLVEKPSAHFVENIFNFVSETECLTENGISVEMVQQALEHFQSLFAISLPSELQDKSVTNLGAALLGKISATASHDVHAEEGEDVPENALMIVADKKDLEAASAAFILRELIIPIIAASQGVTASVLSAGQRMPASITRVALMCTNGLFENPILVNLLDLPASAVILPLMCSNTFVFPSAQGLRGSVAVSALSAEQQNKLVQLIQLVFTEIAVEFQPSGLGANELVLTSRAQDLAMRMWREQSVKDLKASPSPSPKARGSGAFASSMSELPDNISHEPTATTQSTSGRTLVNTVSLPQQDSMPQSESMDEGSRSHPVIRFELEA